MKPSFFFTLMLLMALLASSQNREAAPNILDLDFNGQEFTATGQELAIDLGSRKTGSTVSAQIRIKNQSPEILHISNVRGSCGLSAPSWPRQSIEPGQLGVIQIRYDSSRPGPIDRILTIHANTSRGSTPVNVRGQIIP